MLSRKKFVKKFCSKCEVCHEINVTQKPSFCFDFIYVKKPSKFINNCFSKIKSTDVESMMEGRDDEAAVKRLFCSSKICGRGKVCSQEQLSICTEMFVCQILQMDIEPTTYHEVSGQLEFEEFSMGKGNRNRKKKAKKNKSNNHHHQPNKKKPIFKSSFISGGSEAWQVLIQSIAEKADEIEDWKQSYTS